MLIAITSVQLESSVIEWLDTVGLRVSIVILIIYLARKFGGLLINRAVRNSVKNHVYASKIEEKQREDTLISIFSTVLSSSVWIFGSIIVLSLLGLDFGALIASAGVLGVAFGIGAQSLIKDFVAGIYIIMENQYRVGDVVSLDNTSGVVKRISLRQTVLRDLDGNVHHIPNGSFTVATNMTFEYSQVNLDVGVSYSTDLDKLERIINQVGVDLAGDDAWTDIIVETPKFLRIDDLGDSAIVAKIIGKTVPMKQWMVAGELRKRLKKEFDKVGIEIPFPQMVIHQSNPPTKTKK